MSMMSTQRDHLRAAARDLHARVYATASEDYPDLCGWLLPLPDRARAREECAALQRYMARVVAVAASRISEAYGMGEGARWAARHGLTVADADADAVARAQATASMAAAVR